MTKARVCKVVGQERGLGVTSHAPESAKSVRAWTLTLPIQVPLWDLESQWTLESSEGNCKGQNSWVQKFLCIIRKLLKLKFWKWARMTHLNIWNTSYGQKKGEESNWQFDSRPLKVKNQPNFFYYRWCPTYHWKALNKGYNFASNCIAIGGLHTKLWGPKFVGVLTLGISRLSLGSPGTKCHLDVALVERCKKYYKKEGGGFPQVQAVVSPVNPRLPVARPSTKSAQTMHYPTCCLVCVDLSKWISCLSFFLVPS